MRDFCKYLVKVIRWTPYPLYKKPRNEKPVWRSSR